VVFAIGGAGAEAFLVTVIHRLAQQVGAILIGFVVGPAAVIAIDRRGVEVRIVIVVVALTAQPHLLVALTLVILLLKTVLRHSPLLLERGRTLLREPLLLVQPLLVLRHPLLLLLD